MRYSLILVTLLTLVPQNLQAMIKEPNVAGQFYSDNKIKLAGEVDQMIARARVATIDDHIDVVIVPHAGHIYSGPVAAHAFKALENQTVTTVILLGPTHYFNFDGVAVWPVGQFETPLGEVKVDQESAKQIIAASKDFFFHPDIFSKDHVLEVELPFIQRTFPNAMVVPMIMSRSATREQVNLLAETLAKLTQYRNDILVLVSSDLSHYHDQKTAETIDKRGLDALVKMDYEALWQGHEAGEMEIDGFKEVVTGVLYALQRGAENAKLLKYGTSGDTSGDYNRVVGYAAVALW